MMPEIPGMSSAGDYAMQGLQVLVLVVIGLAVLTVLGAGIWCFRFWRTGA